ATIVFVREAEGHLGAYLALAAAILLVHVGLFLCLRFAGGLIKLLRESGITLLAKIAGLLLAAIAVQLVAESIRGFIAGGSSPTARGGSAPAETSLTGMRADEVVVSRPRRDAAGVARFLT